MCWCASADTIKSGIAKVSLFSATPDLLLYGMFCVMIAAAFWCATLPHSMQIVLTLKDETSKSSKHLLSLERHVLELDMMKTQSHCTHKAALKLQYCRKKKNRHIFSSQLRADQMPAPPQEGQLMCTLFLSMRQ